MLWWAIDSESFRELTSIALGRFGEPPLPPRAVAVDVLIGRLAVLPPRRRQLQLRPSGQRLIKRELVGRLQAAARRQTVRDAC